MSGVRGGGSREDEDSGLPGELVVVVVDVSGSSGSGTDGGGGYVGIRVAVLI